MKCVVLAGGGGLRLWPLSRKKYPKQFLKLGEQNTMFQETVLRNEPVFDKFLVVTNYEFRFIIDKQMEDIEVNEYNSIYELIGRNTAPAITIAALTSSPEEILFVVPADAKIIADDHYYNAIKQAEKLAEQDYIVTFGITPRNPHTGYGYIKFKDDTVEEFKEKPDFETAEVYVKSGNYLWNSGMFMFKASVFLAELKKYRYDIFSACQTICQDTGYDTSLTLEEEDMLAIPSESVDYAVMEKSNKMKVVKSEFYWNDVGGFEALCDFAEKDTEQNSQSGKNIIINKSQNVSVINDTEDKLVIVNDLKDAIVVTTNDAVYITKHGTSSNIKKIIEQNSNNYGDFFGSTIKNYRPWGYYEVLINSAGYKVKRITIYPHKRLSLQKHFFRSEHWIVVDGTAMITLDEKIFEALPNESVYIPMGAVHRVANETKEEVSIIEVAVGENIVEEDIVRLEDDFGR